MGSDNKKMNNGSSETGSMIDDVFFAIKFRRKLAEIHILPT
jgi:hypothetical protein